MSDFSRAILMPGLSPPSDETLMTLALYWEEIVIPDSAYRFSPVFREEQLDESLPQWSAALLELADAGIARLTKADITAEDFMSEGRPEVEDPNGELFLRIGKGEDGRARYTQTMRATVARTANQASPISPSHELLVKNELEWREATASLHADALIARNKLCGEVAASNNLAPISTSLLSHMSGLSDEPEAPQLKGALVSASVDAFAVLPGTSVEQVLDFRKKNVRAVRRFRGAMTDLAAAIQQPNIAPEAVLAAARDIYVNRVEPDLGVLEDRLSESRISFLTRSLLGAAALALTPVTLPTIAETAAKFGAQTINYRFSREKLLEEHPYSFLHRLGKADFVLPRQLSQLEILSPGTAPRDFVYQQIDAIFEILFESRNSIFLPDSPRPG